MAAHGRSQIGEDDMAGWVGPIVLEFESVSYSICVFARRRTSALSCSAYLKPAEREEIHELEVK